MKKILILSILFVVCASINVFAGKKIRNVEEVKQSGFRYIIESLNVAPSEDDSGSKKINIYGMIQQNGCVDKTLCPNIYGNYWIAGDWGSCANSVQSRSVYCFDVETKTNAADSECDIAKKPGMTQPCVAKNYIWLPGPWETCDACGVGTQNRSIFCYDESFIKVDSSHCLEPSTIPTSQACVSTSTCEHHWKVGEWSDCISGQKSRTVSCLDTSDNVVANDNCIALDYYYVPPAVTKGCAGEYDPEYSWRYGDWSECIYNDYYSRWYQTRTTTCVNTSGYVVNRNNCNYGGVREDDTDRIGCVGWVLSDWSECTGDMVQTRTLTCMDKANEVARDDIYCEGMTKPNAILEQGCSIEMYAWHTSDWSCSSCTDMPTREVACKNVFSKEIVSEDLCLSVKPINTDPTNTEAQCNACNYQWVVPEWSDCTLSGSELIETREVTCKDLSYETTVDDSICLNIYGAGSKAMTERSCIPQWRYGGWTECPTTGSFTQRTQSAFCNDQDYRLISDEACLTAVGPKPQTNYIQCYYHWGVPSWGECPALSCGVTIEETRDAYCYRQDGLLDILGMSPSLCESWTGYKAEDNYNLVHRLCTGSCNGAWIVGTVSGCTFNEHFSTGGFMAINYGCKDLSTGSISYDENNMKCTLASKPASDKIGCYYNVNDPEGMNTINAQISAGVKDPAQFSNGEVVPGSDLHTLLYNVLGYIP